MRHHYIQDGEGVLTSYGRFVGSASWTGASGFVVGVNWRSTKIGGRFNNLIRKSRVRAVTVCGRTMFGWNSCCRGWAAETPFPTYVEP